MAKSSGKVCALPVLYISTPFLRTSFRLCFPERLNVASKRLEVSYNPSTSRLLNVPFTLSFGAHVVLTHAISSFPPAYLHFRFAERFEGRPNCAAACGSYLSKKKFLLTTSYIEIEQGVFVLTALAFAICCLHFNRDKC